METALNGFGAAGAGGRGVYCGMLAVAWVRPGRPGWLAGPCYNPGAGFARCNRKAWQATDQRIIGDRNGALHCTG